MSVESPLIKFSFHFLVIFMVFYWSTGLRQIRSNSNNWSMNTECKKHYSRECEPVPPFETHPPTPMQGRMERKNQGRSPWRLYTLQAPSGSKLPLFLSGQPFPPPSTVGTGIIPAHVYHWELQFLSDARTRTCRLTARTKWDKLLGAHGSLRKATLRVPVFSFYHEMEQGSRKREPGEWGEVQRQKEGLGETKGRKWTKGMGQGKGTGAERTGQLGCFPEISPSSF